MTNYRGMAMVIVTTLAVAVGCGDEKEDREKKDSQASVAPHETSADRTSRPTSAGRISAGSLGQTMDVGANNQSKGA